VLGAQFPISCLIADEGGVSGPLLLHPPVLALAYWVPSLVGALRGQDASRIVALNLLLGWTVVWWVVALALVLRRRPAGTAPAALSPPGIIETERAEQRQGPVTGAEPESGGLIALRGEAVQPKNEEGRMCSCSTIGESRNRDAASTSQNR
jgi:hypothetical protein